MHGREETSFVPRTVWTAAHFLIVLVVAWLYFGGGIATVGNWFGVSWQAGDLARRVVLIVFAIALFCRMTVTAFVLLERRFGWSECVSVIGAVAFYQLGFAILGGGVQAELHARDLFGAGLFVLGSCVNTGAELQRKRFHARPANEGKLYTEGLFAVVRHPNYLGDVLWALGWAIVANNFLAFFIPAVAAAGFILKFIPELSAYLSDRYGEQYEEWAKRTKRIFPHIY